MYKGHAFKSKENYIKVRDWLAEQIRLTKIASEQQIEVLSLGSERTKQE